MARGCKLSEIFRLWKIHKSLIICLFPIAYEKLFDYMLIAYDAV